MSDVKRLIRSNVSDAIQGPETEAILTAMELEGIRQSKVSQTVFDQLFLSTAVGIYLDRQAAGVNIVRPDSLGLGDFPFRNIAISTNALKQVQGIVNDLLEIFYGPDAVRAYAQSEISEPYDLTNPSNPDLPVKLEFYLNNKKIVYEVDADDYPTGGLLTATADQVSAAITKAIRAQDSNGYAQTFINPDTNQKYIRIFSGAKGPTSTVRVTGGELVRILGFPIITELVDLQAPGPTVTTWNITKLGNTVRFTFSSGDQPAFNLISEDFTVHIFGDQFTTNNLIGSFPVTSVFQGAAGIGYFEVDIPESIIPSVGILINQTLVTDVTFSKPKTWRPNFRKRFALAWNVRSSTLKVYLPAVSRVVERELIGAAHIHLGKSTSFYNNSTWGSTTQDSQRITVLTPYSFSFTPVDYQADQLAFGGFLTVPYSASKDYEIETYVQSGGTYYKSIQASGPGLGGAQPVLNTSYWEQSDAGGPIDYIRSDNNVTVVAMKGNVQHGIAPISPTNDLSNDIVTISDVLLAEDDPLNPFPGAYTYDPNARYALTTIETDLNQDIVAGNSYSIINVADSSKIPDKQGYVMFELGTNREEYPVPIIGRLSGKLRVDPSYKFQFSHKPKPADYNPATVYNIGDRVYQDGIVYRSKISGNLNNTPPNDDFWQNLGLSAKISYLSSIQPTQIDPLGSDYAFYLTGVAEARTYAQQLIRDITALGIKLEIVIVYPDGIGLGNGDVATDALSYDYDAEIVPQGGSDYRLNDLIYVYDP